jgi:hypothetical protein
MDNLASAFPKMALVVTNQNTNSALAMTRKLMIPSLD